MRLDKKYALLRRKLDGLELRNATRKKEESGRRPELTAAARTKKGMRSPFSSASVFEGQRSKKKRQQITVLDQWVEVEIEQSGKTITTLYPPNEELIRSGQTMWPPPELVYRRLHFLNGVPAEYLWSTTDQSIRSTGGMGVQRMTIDTWLALIEREAAEGAGHLLPTDNLPRPEERGGCECELCVENRQVLKK